MQLIRQDGGSAEMFVADFGQPDLDRAALVGRIEETIRMRADALVNNVAAARRYETLFLDMPHEWFVDSVETNLLV